MKIRKKRLVSMLACVLVLGAALRQDLAVRRYSVALTGLRAPVRLAVLADLHSTWYGDDQARLLAAITDAQPDLIALVGDIVDDARPPEAAQTLLECLATQYSCFYVTGNHEFWGNVAQTKQELRELGIHVLEGESEAVTVNGQQITVCGVDDPEIDGEDGDLWQAQLQACAHAAASVDCSVLLSHRPEYAELYDKLGFDVSLCGHAHGGQVRIPGLLNGLLAPHQGLFPRYAGGRYDLPQSTVVVSRGLMRDWKPRVCNRPELVIVDLVPQA